MIRSSREPSQPLPLVLVLHNVRSLHNVGAAFRTADGAGIERMLLSGLTATPPRTEIEKTALGATRTVPWEYVGHLLPVLDSYRQRGYCICALEQSDRSVPLQQSDLPFPMVLIVGHERVGVEPEILAACDVHAELPMRGESAHSLNVSVATGIALYELGRRFWYDTSI